MEASHQPDIKLAERVLPGALFKALSHIFSQNISDCMLVGGTALSGFYAGHRRSDDLDLFVKNDTAFSQAVLAVRSLKAIDTEVKETARSNQYFKAVGTLEKHLFTADVVLDENLFRQGRGMPAGRITVADIPTIFMMKSAALLSRCGEKDLYDLWWLFENLEGIGTRDIVTQGTKIDPGLRAETLLYSVSSSQVRKEACGFSLDPEMNDKKVFSRISAFKKKLTQDLMDYAGAHTDSDLKRIVDKIRKFDS